MNIWFTSDLHFWHRNVIQYCSRPFNLTDTGVAEMNEIMIRNWNSKVKPEDIVYCLGDFSLAIRPVELYTSRLMGHKILISGNHDWTHPSNKKSRNEEKAASIRKQYYEHGWNEIHNTLKIIVNGHHVNLCHLPYKGDNTDERFERYRLEDKGEWLFCGHVHEKWRMKNKMINVGVDAWGGYPVHVNELAQLIQDNPDGANLGIVKWT